MLLVRGAFSHWGARQGMALPVGMYRGALLLQFRCCRGVLSRCPVSNGKLESKLDTPRIERF
jgi:hypothetical protein